VISRKVERRLAGEFVTRLRIRLASIRQPIAELSGGNQQKAILARWMLTIPRC
jgi:rhamnose transport system ATP-binding protein